MKHVLVALGGSAVVSGALALLLPLSWLGLAGAGGAALGTVLVHVLGTRPSSALAAGGAAVGAGALAMALDLWVLHVLGAAWPELVAVRAHFSFPITVALLVASAAWWDTRSVQAPSEAESQAS